MRLKFDIIHSIELSAKNAIIRAKFTTHYRQPMQRTKKDIYALIQKGERLHAECKEAFGGMPDALWGTYSSFANTDGGVIVLGIKELADVKSNLSCGNLRQGEVRAMGKHEIVAQPKNEIVVYQPR